MDVLSNLYRSIQYRDATTNFNLLTKPGVYTYGTDADMRPSDYGVVLVLRNGYWDGFNGSGWIYQIAFATDGNVFMRYSINATADQADTNWSIWKKVVFGDISGTTLNLKSNG